VTDLTTLVTEPMCLPLDVRMISSTLKDALMDYPDQKLLWYEQMARRRILARLRSRYVSDATLRVSTPVVSTVVQSPIYRDEIMNDDPHQQGVNKDLRVVTALTGVFSDQWVIKFTDDSGAFTIDGLFSLSQGTGAYGSDFTSTNTYVLIYSDAWYGKTKIVTNDKFYFTTNNYHQYITFIASLLVASYVIQFDNLNVDDTYSKQAEKMLDELADVHSGVGLGNAKMHIDDAPVSMPGLDVDYLGRKFSDEPNEDTSGNKGEEFWENQIND
jgi:hypothetical protein